MKLKFIPRLFDWYIYAIALTALIYFLSPAGLGPKNVGEALFKLTLIALGGIIGYILDRRLFPYARPHELLQNYANAPGSQWLSAFGIAMLRRAIIVGCCMLALAVGI